MSLIRYLLSGFPSSKPLPSGEALVVKQMVQVVKQILQKTFCNQKHEYKELLTFVLKVEGIINSCGIINHPRGYIDNVVMSSHLVLGRRLLTHIDGNETDELTEENITKVHGI